MKPLFIPLKGEYYDLFVSGDKTFELRRFGLRWNEKVCAVGRSVTLSRGYGKTARIAGIIYSFDRFPAQLLSGLNRIAVGRLYGTLDLDIARIGIALTGGER